MAKKYIGNIGLGILWKKIVQSFVKKDGNKVLSDVNFTQALANKLNGLNNYTLPKATGSTLGGIKIGAGLTADEDGTVSATGTDVTIDSSLNSSSTNPVQNKVIYTELAKKINDTDLVEFNETEIDEIIAEAEEEAEA